MATDTFSTLTYYLFVLKKKKKDEGEIEHNLNKIQQNVIKILAQHGCPWSAMGWSLLCLCQKRQISKYLRVLTTF